MAARNHKGRSIMAKGKNEGQGEPNGSWVQPVTYHAVSATNRGRGYYVRIPYLPRLTTIAEIHGAEAAEIDFRAIRRYLTQLGQSRASAKDVAHTPEAEKAAIVKAFAEFADGSLSVKGGDTDDSESAGGFAKAFRNHATVRSAAATALNNAKQNGNDNALVDLAITKYWDVLVEKFGEQVAAEGYTPTKKGAGTGAGATQVIGDLAL